MSIIEHVGPAMRTLYITEDIAHKLSRYPAKRGGLQQVNLVLTGNRLATNVPVYYHAIAIMSPHSFELFAAHEVVDVEVPNR